MRRIPHQVKADPYDWPHDGPLCPSQTALMVIDMQRDFCDEGGYLAYQGFDCKITRAIISRTKELLSLCRKNGISVIFTRESHRPDLSDLSSRELFRSRNNAHGRGIGDQGPHWRFLVRGEAGCEIVQDLTPLPGEPVIDKPGKGAFTNTDLDLILRTRGIRNLIFCGVTTDVCVHTTMREANDRGYDCLLVEDCCASGDPTLHAAAIEMVKVEGGIFGATAKRSDLLAAFQEDGIFLVGIRTSGSYQMLE